MKRNKKKRMHRNRIKTLAYDNDIFMSTAHHKTDEYTIFVLSCYENESRNSHKILIKIKKTK